MFKEVVKIGSMFIDTFILITNNHGNLDYCLRKSG